MIRSNARLHIALVPLETIQVKEFQIRDIEVVVKYYHMLLKHPDEYLGLLYLVCSQTHEGMYTLLDGHRRYCAYILAGRSEALCVIEHPEGIVVD